MLYLTQLLKPQKIKEYIQNCINMSNVLRYVYNTIVFLIL